MGAAADAAGSPPDATGVLLGLGVLVVAAFFTWLFTLIAVECVTSPVKALRFVHSDEEAERLARERPGRFALERWTLFAGTAVSAPLCLFGVLFLSFALVRDLFL